MKIKIKRMVEVEVDGYKCSDCGRFHEKKKDVAGLEKGDRGWYRTDPDEAKRVICVICLNQFCDILAAQKRAILPEDNLP